MALSKVNNTRGNMFAGMIQFIVIHASIFSLLSVSICIGIMYLYTTNLPTTNHLYESLFFGYTVSVPGDADVHTDYPRLLRPPHNSGCTTGTFFTF